MTAYADALRYGRWVIDIKRRVQVWQPPERKAT